jgi:hypothetical protein
LLRVRIIEGRPLSNGDTMSLVQIASPLKSRGSFGIVETGEKKFAFTPAATL